MDRFPPIYREFMKYWEVLEELVEKDEFIIPLEVYNESKQSPPIIRKWVEKNKESIIFETKGMYTQLGKVLKKYPKMAYKDLRLTRKYHADSHLIALAIDLSEGNNNVTIVCDESPGSNKIPTVAEYYKIKCITLYNLFEKSGVLKRNYNINNNSKKDFKKEGDGEK